MSPRRQTGDNLVAANEGMCFADVSEYAVGDKNRLSKAHASRRASKK